ncbi:MAG: pyridoxamine 5'-phosphate oxidase family protein [Actinomycetes bacterium]
MTIDQTSLDGSMSDSDSWAVLRHALVGRLAVAVGDRPDIFPVNFAVDHGSVVFRTAAGTKLAAAAGRPVAFEADGYDPGTGEAWSVVVKGVAQEVTELDDVLAALDLPLFPWHTAPKPRIIRITPDSISGRRFTARGATKIETPRRVAPE